MVLLVVQNAFLLITFIAFIHNKKLTVRTTCKLTDRQIVFRACITSFSAENSNL